MYRFSWDPAKAASNRKKHDVDFDDAMLVFEDPHAFFHQDRVDDISGEQRWHVIGFAGHLALLLVVHTVREERGDEVIRLISARPATRKERRVYEANCL